MEMGNNYGQVIYGLKEILFKFITTRFFVSNVATNVNS